MLIYVELSDFRAHYALVCLNNQKFKNFIRKIIIENWIWFRIYLKQILNLKKISKSYKTFISNDL